MTRNPIEDYQEFSGVFLNGLLNAHDNEAIVSGCTPSKGTGDFEVDIASGTVLVGGKQVDVNAQTVTVSDASALGTGEARVDIITINSSGTAAVTEGTGDTSPVAPDIPSTESLCSMVVVQNGDTSLSSSSIFDYRVLSSGDVTPLYGDESDGSITDSANATRGGILEVTDYTLESGNTLTVDTADGFLIIQATNSIDISGTINGDGAAANGGANGGGTDPAENGGTGAFVPQQTGGAGGSGPDNNGGDGGDGDTGTPTHQTVNKAAPFTLIQHLRDGSGDAGAGGGGGGDGGAGTTGNGSDGSFPGGGGGAASDTDGSAAENGGTGGDGGALVFLVAPTVSISGTITCDGTDGGAGDDGEAPAGGGGGGSGGVIIALAPDLTNTGTFSTAGGSGGAAGTDTGDGNESAGAGANGASGFTYTRV